MESLHIVNYFDVITKI